MGDWVTTGQATKAPSRTKSSDGGGGVLSSLRDPLEQCELKSDPAERAICYADLLQNPLDEVGNWSTRASAVAEVTKVRFMGLEKKQRVEVRKAIRAVERRTQQVIRLRDGAAGGGAYMNLTKLQAAEEQLIAAKTKLQGHQDFLVKRTRDARHITKTQGHMKEMSRWAKDAQTKLRKPGGLERVFGQVTKWMGVYGVVSEGYNTYKMYRDTKGVSWQQIGKLGGALINAFAGFSNLKPGLALADAGLALAWGPNWKNDLLGGIGDMIDQLTTVHDLADGDGKQLEKSSNEVLADTMYLLNETRQLTKADAYTRTQEITSSRYDNSPADDERICGTTKMYGALSACDPDDLDSWFATDYDYGLCTRNGFNKFDAKNGCTTSYGARLTAKDVRARQAR